MSLNFNNPFSGRSAATTPPVKDEMPGGAATTTTFKNMPDEQRREFLTAELQRLEPKPDRTDDENTKLALIRDFLNGMLSPSGLEELTKLYSPTGTATSNAGKMAFSSGPEGASHTGSIPV